MKHKKLSETDKLFRLLPLLLILLFIFCGYSMYSNDLFKEFPDGDFKKISFFLGVYIGNGIPRFFFYVLIYGYLKYKYNGIQMLYVLNGPPVWKICFSGFAIACFNIWASEGYIVNVFISVILLFILETLIAQVCFTLQKEN